MNAMTAVAKPARIVPSAPQIFALRKLERAPENVRHHYVDEDVSGLADDIAAHGLLQSLIGYRHHDRIRIVGGGRRLQALHQLLARDAIDTAWQVPVLIRDAGEAVELSLAENLQQRTMSPVDEFFAFKSLIDTGRHSPAGLATRFGFSERVVKQRLRLADLAPVVLDALALRQITLDAAMTYAQTQDQDLQRAIFAVEARRSYDPHRLTNIRFAIQAKGMTADDPVIRFLGIDRYEAAGGGYEDGLFADVAAAAADRVLDRPILAQTAAAALIDERMPDLIATACEVEDLAPTITGYVIAPGLKLQRWGSDAAKAPPGRTRIDRHDQQSLWREIRDHRIDAQLLVGLDREGALIIHPRTVFVPMAARRILCPPAGISPAAARAEQAAMSRDHDIALWAQRLAVGVFEGTPFEGRAYWPEARRDHSYSGERAGIPGRFVHVHIFTPDALIATKQKQAERHVDKAAADRAARNDMGVATLKSVGAD